MPTVNPQMLAWAREHAGLSLEEAARAIGMSGQLAADRLAEMERGERAPTHGQLAGMAAAYRRPLLTFYLPAPPESTDPVPDYRRLPDRQDDTEHLVQALIRDVRARQALVRDALVEADEAEPKRFVGSAPPGVDAVSLAALLTQTLRFDREAYRARRTAGEAFSALRAAVEEIGVYVLVRGSLGHHTSRIEPTMFRGLALADRIAPFIVINENDAKAAWSFTLLHEFCHLLLGGSGVSGYGSEQAVERLCDGAAALFLLEPGETQTIDVAGDPDTLAEAIGAFAQPRKVSRTMVAYHLLRDGRIDGNTYQTLAARFAGSRRQPSSGSGGPDFYVVARHRLGPHLLGVVGRMMGEGLLSTTRAGKVLGVKPTMVTRMLEMAG